MEKQSKSDAKKAYWANISPEERANRARKAAIAKQQQLTPKQRRDHAIMMVQKKNQKK